ncbi:hypothetical protein AB0C68_40185 [Streptomyces tendae]|uniref:hypothetical protein n=1 Tax=Streptomyces tendae TaxID=1932 RepID=UPI0033FD8B6B
MKVEHLLAAAWASNGGVGSALFINVLEGGSVDRPCGQGIADDPRVARLLCVVVGGLVCSLSKDLADLGFSEVTCCDKASGSKSGTVDLFCEAAPCGTARSSLSRVSLAAVCPVRPVPVAPSALIAEAADWSP